MVIEPTAVTSAPDSIAARLIVSCRLRLSDAATPTPLELVLEFDCELLLPLESKLLILGRLPEPPLFGVELR